MVLAIGCGSKPQVVNPKYKGFVVYKPLPKVPLHIKKSDISTYQQALKDELILIKKLRLQNEAYRKQILNYMTDKGIK